jgi:hypothetical protein
MCLPANGRGTRKRDEIEMGVVIEKSRKVRVLRNKTMRQMYFVHTFFYLFHFLSYIYIFPTKTFKAGG